MAEISIGIGTSHSSQVSLTTDLWPAHAELDKHRTSYAELLAGRGDTLAGELAPEVIEGKYERIQSGVAQVREALLGAEPDVVVIVGDDQRELFRDEGIPTFGICRGEFISDLPPEEELAPTHKAVLWATHGDEREDYPVSVPLADWIIEEGIRQDFDVFQFTEQQAKRSLGHAYTFVRRRLMPMEQAPIPMVPVFINTYYPPNQPTVSRCIKFGDMLGRAIQSWQADAKVAVVASGGLSHFVIDEELDRRVLDALSSGDLESLLSVPAGEFQSGTSEILNWVVAGAALRTSGLQMKLLDYIPGYRSLAGTGCGMAFAEWT